MIQLNTTYIIDNDSDKVIFSYYDNGTITGTYKDGTISGILEGNVLKATFHNTKVNVSGLMEIIFHENGFEAKWKKGLEHGPMKGRWRGKLINPEVLQISIHDKIKNLIGDKLIQPQIGISTIYAALENYFNKQYDRNEEIELPVYHLSKNELVGAFSFLQSKNIHSIGIDFPIQINKGVNRPVLMICALDPLRANNEDKDNSDLIADWVPFSIIKNPEKENKHTELENLVFFHTLLDSFDIYVTDIYKVFFRENGKVSNKISSYTQLSIHNELLKSEIEIIKPVAILTLGNGARDAICSLMGINTPVWTDSIYKTSINGLDLVMAPHISGAANGTKAPILNNENYSAIEGKNNQKYARIIKKALTF
jgi:hypothetical protein